MVEKFKNTEFGTIPTEWHFSNLETISEKIMVGIASAATHAYRQKGVVLLRNQNIRNGYLDDSDILYVDEDYEKIYSNKRLKKGDLITSRTGYPGATCLVPSKYEGAQSFTTLIVRPKKNHVHGEYLNHYINSDKGQSFFFTNQIGGSQKNVNAGTLRTMPIPLPPTKAEQTAIATALNDADALITSLERLITKKKAIKQGAMQGLLRAKEGWKERKLGECLLQNPKYGINAPSVPYSESLPTYLRITDITEDGHYSREDMVCVDRINSDQYYLEMGDLVFARTGASVGKTYLYDKKDGHFVFAGFLIKVKTNPHILIPSYLFYFSQTETYWFWVRSTSTRTGQPGINGNEYKSLLINIPPIIEQTKIVQILSDMDAEIALLEQKLEKQKRIKQGMTQVLLTGKIRLI